MHHDAGVNQKAVDLQDRIARFAGAVERLCAPLTAAGTAQPTIRKLTAAAAALQTGYRETCASSSPEEFVERISAVARHAKKAVACLVLLVELRHLPIEAARETILEARALEAIVAATRNTAKRRARGPVNGTIARRA